MNDCGCEIEVETAEQSRVLWILLAINFAMFLGEFGAGSQELNPENAELPNDV